ncbi:MULTISPECIES: anion permease [Pseudomonas]|uniref:anion permease n=1 Tax=Pseudomonas TaxID=286 RepID=UPI001F1ECD23|nr:MULTISPECIES: anion permease [Pseudomonas]
MFLLIITSAPRGGLSILGVVLVAAARVTSEDPGTAIRDALSSFSSSLIWLIAVAVMISRGLIKTGLGRVSSITPFPCLANARWA